MTEAAYVLTKVHGVPRSTAVDALIELLQKENLGLLDLSKAEAIAALLLARPSGRISFADALLWASARKNAFRSTPLTGGFRPVRLRSTCREAGRGMEVTPSRGRFARMS